MFLCFNLKNLDIFLYSCILILAFWKEDDNEGKKKKKKVTVSELNNKNFQNLLFSQFSQESQLPLLALLDRNFKHSNYLNLYITLHT
jgi:hypothetical protein